MEPPAVQAFLACLDTPVAGTLVYYFPHGHAKQSTSLVNLLPTTKDRVLCIATPRSKFFSSTDNPYARLTLRPSRFQDTVPDMDHDTGVESVSKFLKQTNTTLVGAFEVDRVNMAGWNKFVNEKLIASGNSLIFIKNGKDSKQIILGLQRSLSNLEGVVGRLKAEEIEAEVSSADSGNDIVVDYYTEVPFPECVVKKEVVESALQAKAQVREKEGGGNPNSAASSIWRFLQASWVGSEETVLKVSLSQELLASSRVIKSTEASGSNVTSTPVTFPSMHSVGIQRTRHENFSDLLNSVTVVTEETSSQFFNQNIEEPTNKTKGTPDDEEQRNKDASSKHPKFH